MRIEARTGSRVAGVLAVLGACVALGTGTGMAEPPSDPGCLPLGAGSTGLLAVGGYVPGQDDVSGDRGGFGPKASADVRASLPRDVVFKDETETFSNEYAFALRGGRIYVRIAEVGRAVPGEPWHLLELPACMDGRITEISADHRLFLAIGPEDQIYSHDMPGGDLSAERWTWRWGPYFWTGSGMRMPEGVRDWATSEFTSAETFTDTSGREQHPIGVATVYLLRRGGRINYLDPWLPNDTSREVCGPRRGTLPLAGLSGSGSTVFVVGRNAGVYTRLYDFDVSGANTVLGEYSWERGRPAEDTRWQLPGPRWLRHRPPPGTITDRISLAKTGTDAADRLLRIEGRARDGRSGYFEKAIGERGRRAWEFVATGEPLRGRPIRAIGPKLATAPADIRYSGTIEGLKAKILNFNAECSPATLRIRVPPRRSNVSRRLPLDLTLHSSDGLRQEMRGDGLDDFPREYNGAIEVPAALLRNLPEAGPRRTWIEQHLGGQRFTTSPLAVTATRLRFTAQCWELTLNGEPARPDQTPPRPDLGAAVGRFTEQQEDGRPPVVC